MPGPVRLRDKSNKPFPTSGTTTTEMSKDTKQEIIAHQSAQGGAITVGQMSIADVLQSVAIIKDIQAKVMKPGSHYGVIPGTKKPTLLLPGAQVLALTFRMRPKYTMREIKLEGLHRENQVDCELVTAGGEYIGQGLGCCSTLESKYRFRTHEAFKLTDFEVPKTYWALKSKADQQRMLRTVADVHNGIFGTKKIAGVWRIIELSGEVEQIEHPNPADFWNTVLKIAKKRAYVDAILTATAASDVFTQDMEDVAANAEAATEVTGRDWEPGGEEPIGDGKEEGKEGGKGTTRRGGRKKEDKDKPAEKGATEEPKPTDPNPAGVSEEILNAWPATREKPKSWHDNHVHRNSSLGTRKLEDLTLAELHGLKEKFVDNPKFWVKPTAEDLLLRAHILEAIEERTKEGAEENQGETKEPVNPIEEHALESAEKLAARIKAAGLQEGDYFLKLAELNQIPDGKTWTSIDEVDDAEWLDFANHTFEGFLKLAGLVERKKSGTLGTPTEPAASETTQNQPETTPQTTPADAIGSPPASPPPETGTNPPPSEEKPRTAAKEKRKGYVKAPAKPVRSRKPSKGKK